MVHHLPHSSLEQHSSGISITQVEMGGQMKYVYLKLVKVSCIIYLYSSYTIIMVTMDIRYVVSPTISGTRPPPGAFFSLTSIDECRALMFGGKEGKHMQRISDLHLIDFHTMVQ